MAELNAGKEAWQAEHDSVHQLELQSLQAELELEREKHSSAIRDLERTYDEELAAVRKSLEHDHEVALTELNQQRRSDVAETKANLEQRLADREMELLDELHSVNSDAAHLRAEVGDLTLSKSKAASDYELHIAALKQKLDLKSEQHDQEMSEIESKHQREIDAVTADLELLQVNHEKVRAELGDRHSREVEMFGVAQQSKLSSLSTKFYGEVTHLADRVGWLRGEVADVLRRSAVDLKNDATVIERELQQLDRLHSSSMSQLSTKYSEDVAYYKDQLHAVQREHERSVSQLATDHQAETSRLRQHIEKSLTTQHQSVVADITARHMTEMSQLQSEIDRLREKCDSLTLEVTHCQHDVKQRDDDIAHMKESHSVELQALNERRDRELSEFREQKDGELMQSVNSLQTKHADEMSEAEAGHGTRVNELMEQVEKLRFDYGQTVADVHREKQQEMSALEETVVTVQKQNENVSVQLEFKSEEITHLQDQLNVLGQEHSRVLQEIERSSNELLEWKQLAADNSALVEKNAEETEDLRAQLEILQTEKDHMLKEHTSQHEEEVTRLQMQIDAVTKAHEEIGHLKDATKSLEQQFSEAESSHLLQMEQLKQQHNEEKVTLECDISFLQENVNELKDALAEKETIRMDVNLLTEANVLLQSESEDLRVLLEQQTLKLQEETSIQLKLQTAKEAVDEKLSVAENQLREITDEKVRLENECTVLSDKCKNLEMQVEELQSISEEIEKQFLQRGEEKRVVKNQLVSGLLPEAVEGKRQVCRRVQDLIEENNMLLSQNSDLDDKNTLLQNQWSSLKQEHESLVSQLESVECQLNSLRQDNESVVEELQLVKTQSAAMTSELDGLKKELQEAEQQVQSKTEQEAVLNAQLQALEDKNAVLATDLEQMKQLSDYSLSGDLKAAKEGENLVNVSVEDLTDQLKERTSEMDLVRSELQRTSEQCIMFESKVEAEKKDRQLLEARLESLKCDCESLESELEKSRAESEELKQSSASLEIKLQSVTDQLSFAEQEKQNVIEQKNSVEFHLNDTKELVSSLQSQLILAKEVGQPLQKQLASATEEIESFHGQLRDLEGVIKVLECDKQHLETQLRNVLANSSSVAEQLHELETSHESLNNLLRDSQELCSALTLIRDQLTASNEQTTRELGEQQKENRILLEQSESLQRQLQQAEDQLHAAKDMEDICRLQTVRLEEAEEQSQNWRTKLSEAEQSNKQLSDQLQALKEQNEKESESRLKDFQEENEVLKSHASIASEAVKKLELRVSELTREKESLGTQLETMVERQKVFQEQDNIAQAELRILRQQLSELSKTQDNVEETDATTAEQKIQSELQVIQQQLVSQELDTDTKEGLSDGRFDLHKNKVLREKVASLQQMCNKQQEELEVARRKMAWLRKSRQVTFADELKQSESAEGGSLSAVDAVDENSEEERTLKHMSDCHAAQLASTEAVLEEEVDLLVETEERCANVEADRDELASKYVGLVEKHKFLLKELQHHQAELANERSRAVEREQLLKERQTELATVREKLRQMKVSYDEMCEKQQTEEINTQVQLLSKSYLLSEAEERLSQLEAVSREVTKDLTERVNEREAGVTSHEELIMDLRAQLFAEQERVAETDKALAEKEKLLQESKMRLRKLEEKYQILEKQQETIMSAADERAKTQVNEMKRKCIAKVKSVQSEYEAKLSDSATALSVTKSAADARVNELEKFVHERETEIETLQTRLLTAETDLEKKSSEIQLKLERSREQLNGLESQLADTDMNRKEALDAQAEQLNRENEERRADLKRRAETRLGQIKRQLKIDKQSAVGELNRVADELRARLAACEDELHDALEQGKDAQNKDGKITELTDSLSDVRRLLQQRNAEMTEKESVIGRCQSEFENLEKKLQNSVSEIDVLTGSLKAAELSQTDLRHQLSVTEMERQKLAERCEVEVRTAALDNEQELDRLKAEFDEKLRDTENEHNAKIKQLVKEFRLQMAHKEKEFQSNYNEVLGTSFPLIIIMQP